VSGPDQTPDRLLKVVRIIARLNVGGPARHVILADRGLRQRGHRTLLVHGEVDAGEASLEEMARAAAIPTFKISRLGRRVRPIADFLTFLQLVRLLFREAPDVVHTHTAKAGALGRMAAWLFNLTRARSHRSLVVHTFHGHVLSGYFRPSVSRLVQLAERWLGTIADRIVTLSPRQQSDIVDRFRIAPRWKTAVVPLGLDLGPLLQVTPESVGRRHELAIGDSEIVIGYVGRMVPIKDLETLVAAFAIARAACPHLVLLLAGDGPARARLERAALAANVSDCVRFVGWEEDLARAYATMDILALSSLNEGTPVAIIEAMAAGKPTVATDVGGVADVVSEGQTGLLVQPRQPAALAQALVKLAADPTRRRIMGAAARIDAAERYSADRLVTDLEALYRDGLDEIRHARRRSAQ
jgi:glycosyltransferase involved in cell wall biosynthesis